jgi:hypothetical protein
MTRTAQTSHWPRLGTLRRSFPKPAIGAFCSIFLGQMTAMRDKLSLLCDRANGHFRKTVVLRSQANLKLSESMS